MDRRQFLAFLTTGALAPLALRCSAQNFSTGQSQVLTSQHGLLAIALTAEVATIDLAGRSATLITYNRQVPGPRLELRPGDRVQIRFTNRLQEPTNLHFHGLHIPPTGLGDDSLRAVLPGETAAYDFTLPADHPSGLFWYHPHYHGLVAQQVFSGLAGPLVVRGEVDDLAEIQAAQEEFLILQDFDLNRQGQVREPMPMFRMWGREGSLITVNGQTTPVLDLPQGGLLRLRLLNASASRYYQLQLSDHPWWLMAVDGVALETPLLQETMLLAPGQRRDVLVPGQASPGTYALQALPYDRGISAMAASMGHGPRGGPMMGQGKPRPMVLSEPLVIAQIRYQGQVAPVALPQTLGTVEPLPAPDIVRQFVLDHGLDPETGDPFLINGRAFGHHRVDTQVKLGTVEDWVIKNQAGMDHPFHLHTNSFQVISRNGQTEPLRAWQDVVNIRAYETVRIRIPFRDFAGKTVYHCHILDHEDQGMMGIVEMQPG